MAKYYVCTDGFSTTVEADSWDDAVSLAFEGDGDYESVEEMVEDFADIGDGAECLIRNEETGEEQRFGPY